MRAEAEIAGEGGRIAVVATSLLLGFSVLLVPAYSSTDFEVHRNWLAVTWHLEPAKWYRENTSEWTLDYPPFFAYFERALATGLHAIGEPSGMLEISAEPKFDDTILAWHRFTVIGTQLFFLAAVYQSSGHLFKTERARVASIVALALCTPLQQLDNIHFQYNSMLTALVLLSICAVERRHFSTGAVLFVTLLCFKHIYVYYAPAFVLHFFWVFLLRDRSVTGFLSRSLKLALCLILPVAAALLPILYSAKWRLDPLFDIAARLFPLQRGLTHAYWAPNVWALYNALDLTLYHSLRLIGLGADLAPPQYIRGLVQTYSHSVLPTVGPVACLLLTAVFAFGPSIWLVARRKNESFAIHLTFSSMAFFLFGYHVHEKAILLPLLPLLVLALQDARFADIAWLFGLVSFCTVSPLLFTLFETPAKLALGIVALGILRASLGQAHGKSSSLSTWQQGIVSVLVATEVFFSVAQLFLVVSLAFLPLLLVSTVNSIAVFGIYSSLIYRVAL